MGTFWQIFGVLGTSSLEWPESSDGMFSAFELASVDPSTLNLECLCGSEPLGSYALQILALHAVFMFYFICFCASRMLPSNKHWKIPYVVNTSLVVVQTVLISVTNFSVAPLQCFEHPNGERSMMMYPSIVCFESDYGSFLCLGCVGLVTLIVPFNVGCVVGVVQLYVHRGNVLRSQQVMYTFKLFFARWRAECWWWGVCFSLRQQLLALSLIFVADDGPSQIVWACSLFAGYLALVCLFRPWLITELNCLDALGSVIVIVVLSMVGLIPPGQTTSHSDVYEAMLLVAMVFLSVLLLAFVGRAGFQALLQRVQYRALAAKYISDDACVELLCQISQCCLPRSVLVNVVSNMSESDRVSMVSFLYAFEQASLYTINFFASPGARAIVVDRGMLEGVPQTELRSRIHAHVSSSKAESYI